MKGSGKFGNMGLLISARSHRGVHRFQIISSPQKRRDRTRVCRRGGAVLCRAWMQTRGTATAAAFSPPSKGAPVRVKEASRRPKLPEPSTTAYLPDHGFDT